jgi:hypothetical protein
MLSNPDNASSPYLTWSNDGAQSSDSEGIVGRLGAINTDRPGHSFNIAVVAAKKVRRRMAAISALRFEQSLVPGHRHRLGATPHVELAIEAGGVVRHRFRPEIER